MKKNKKALLVIDMQNGFSDKNHSWYVPGIEKCSDNITAILKRWNKQDVFLTAFVNKNIRITKSKDSFFQKNGKDCAVIDTFEKIFRSRIFYKNGYSAWKNEKIKKNLSSYDVIYICGVEAQSCVLFTAAETYDLAKKFFIISDAVAGFGVFKSKKTFSDYCKKRFGECLCSVNDIIK